jgi:hypothetical protein
MMALRARYRLIFFLVQFPRVILHLDPRSVELTDECKIAVEEVKDEESLVQFHHDYGPSIHLYPTYLQLIAPLQVLTPLYRSLLCYQHSTWWQALRLRTIYLHRICKGRREGKCNEG